MPRRIDATDFQLGLAGERNDLATDTPGLFGELVPEWEQRQR